MKESLACKHPPNSCQHSYKYLAQRDAIATQLYVSYELTKPSKIMWTHRIRSFRKWFSRLGPLSLLLLHGHDSQNGPLVFSGPKYLEASQRQHFWCHIDPRPESIAQLWHKHWWPKATGILRPGRSPSTWNLFRRASWKLRRKAWARCKMLLRRHRKPQGVLSYFSDAQCAACEKFALHRTGLPRRRGVSWYKATMALTGFLW